MAEVIGLEELRRIGFTLRRMQDDQRTVLSRMDGIERRFAALEERQAEQEARLRALGDDIAQLDRKLDVVTALVRDDVAQLEAKMQARFAEMEARFAAVLAAIAELKRPAG